MTKQPNDSPAARHRKKMRSAGYVKASIWIHASTLAKIDALKSIYESRTAVIEHRVVKKLMRLRGGNITASHLTSPCNR